MRKLITLTLLIFLAGCVSTMWPMQVIKDDFDGATIVRQPPVVACRPILTNPDNPQYLGFEWSTKNPDLVILTAQLNGIDNIVSLEFMSDDKPINNIKIASPTTEFDTGSSSSSRRFSIPIEDFRKIAAARIVKMKTSSISAYNVSRFGQEYPDVIVTTRFTPFLAKIESIKSK